MSIENIKPDTAINMVAEGVTFVDVREPAETDSVKYDLSKITYLPLSVFEQKFMAMIPLDKNTKIILACKAGGRSMMAASFLEKNGYKNLYNLEGGITAWMSLGKPVKTGDTGCY